MTVAHAQLITKNEPSNRNLFTIPVFPHVRKFILKKYRLSRDPIKLEEYTTLGKLVTLNLRDNKVSAEQNGQYRDRLNSSITIILTDKQSKLGPRMSKLMRINIDIDRTFKESLIAWIDALREAGIPAFTACKMFLSHYGIDEKEYSHDAAYQYWQRNKD